MGVFQDVVNVFKRDRNARRSLAIVLLTGAGLAAAVRIANRRLSKKMAREQSLTVKLGNVKPKRENRFAVDGVFLRRLRLILSIVVPGVASSEFAMVALLGALLVSRTAFSVLIAELIGKNAQAAVSRDWNGLTRGIVRFALVTIPAAGINAGLKYSSSLLSLMFRVRLNEHVHKVGLQPQPPPPPPAAARSFDRITHTYYCLAGISERDKLLQGVQLGRTRQDR
jgi:hypothetical protein